MKLDKKKLGKADNGHYTIDLKIRDDFSKFKNRYKLFLQIIFP